MPARVPVSPTIQQQRSASLGTAFAPLVPDLLKPALPSNPAYIDMRIQQLAGAAFDDVVDLAWQGRSCSSYS
jgi:hypothetical protein